MKLHKENKTIRHFMETCRGLHKMMLDESENQPHSLYPLLYPVTHIAPGERSVKNVAMSSISCITRNLILRSLLLIAFTAYSAK
jgi:hypothetical protein